MEIKIEETATPDSVDVGYSKYFQKLNQSYQLLLDRCTPHINYRWLAAGLLVFCFLLRIFLKQGWYIVTYALAIYQLNLFIGFLTPKIDPAFEVLLNDDEDDVPKLPTKSNEEFRPFIRRLPEFKFWYSMIRSTIFAMICTFFDCFDVPVFWPILVLYFLTLFCMTMKQQLKHMIKYKYLPFTRNKPRYQNVDNI